MEDSEDEEEEEEEEEERNEIETSEERIKKNERKQQQEKKKRLEKLKLENKQKQKKEALQSKRKEASKVRKEIMKEKRKKEEENKERQELKLKEVEKLNKMKVTISNCWTPEVSKTKKKNRKEKMKSKSLEEVCTPKLEIPKNYKKVEGNVLLSEDGEKLIRKLGETDDELRKRMRISVKAQIEAKDDGNEALSVTSDDNWVEVNLGKTYVSDDNVHNLFAAVSAQKVQLGTVMLHGGGGYMINEDGTKFELTQYGKQLRFKARIYDKNNKFEEVTFVHDSGCGVNLINKRNTLKWKNKGNDKLFIGGYNGGESVVVGGKDLKVKLKAMKEKSGKKEVKFPDNVEELTLSMVIEEIAKENSRPTTKLSKISTINSVNPMEEDINSDMNEIMKELPKEEREMVMKKVKNATQLIEDELENKSNSLEATNVPSKKKLGEKMSNLKKIEVMNEMSRIFPHLSQESLNRMVREGDIKGGIEMGEKYKDEATYTGKGTRTRIHKKRSKSKQEDPAIGVRCPFYVTMVDLVDLRNEEVSNRWDYGWIMPVMCKEYGIVKIYPLRGKGDVAQAWRQFKQWCKLMSPYCKKKLGMNIETHIVANDRGSEFMTTYGRTRSEMDEILLKDGIARWSPTTGDSNKLGKIEKFNRTMIDSVNVMLRRSGASNALAYDAALFFEILFNTSPTTSNIVGKGEAIKNV